MSLNALLILSSSTFRRPSQIRATLTSVIQSKVRFNGTLYVEVWKPFNVHSPSSSNPLYGNPSLWSQASTTIYSHSTAKCPHLDVRFIVKNSVPNSPQQQQQQPLLETKRLINLVFIDNQLKCNESEIQDFVGSGIANKCESVSVQFLEENCVSDEEPGSGSNKRYDVVVLGGTFDRIHNGHKILLTEALLKAEKELIVGVTDEGMTKSKLLFDLVEPVETRMANVRDFLEDVSPPLEFRIVPIADPFGPTITDENIQAIVVSQETIRGGAKINEIREQKGFPPLEVHIIELVAETNKESDREEDKVSSSSRRLRILGERLRPSLREPSTPYIIGLTGGSCSGKSTICDYLNSLQIATINCDQLGHEAYKPGTDCFKTLTKVFGEDILNESKTEINRQVLGSKVFGKPEELKKLTDIVWPEIGRLTQLKIQELQAEGHRAIILDAAVLLEAKWDEICHEVWVAFVPKAEAVERIQARDKKSKEEAEKRIDSQLSNQERLSKATFAFCSLWEKEFTRKQVDKAWSEVQTVIKSIS